MRKPTSKFSIDKIILYLSGLIPVFWLGLRSAPYFQEKGLVGILEHSGEIFGQPFNIAFEWGNFRVALIFCLLYAISDEFHQTFVAGRSGQITDVLIDLSGSLAGILLLSTILYLTNRKKQS